MLGIRGLQRILYEKAPERGFIRVFVVLLCNSLVATELHRGILYFIFSIKSVKETHSFSAKHFLIATT